MPRTGVPVMVHFSSNHIVFQRFRNIRICFTAICRAERLSYTLRHFSLRRLFFAQTCRLSAVRLHNGITGKRRSYSDGCSTP